MFHALGDGRLFATGGLSVGHSDPDPDPDPSSVGCSPCYHGLGTLAFNLPGRQPCAVF